MAIDVGDAVLELGLDTKDFDSKMAATGKKFTGGIDKWKKGFKIAGAAIAGTAIGIGTVSLKMAADFDGAMREVNTMMLLNQEEFQALSADVRELSADMGVNAVDSAKALYQTISAGIPKENAIDFLKVATKAAIGGLTDTATAVDGLSTVINAYGMDASDAEKVADIMFTTISGGKTTFEELSASLYNVLPLASAVGWEFEEVSAALAAMTQKGIPTAQATTQLRQVMVSLLKPTGDAIELIDKYGIELYDETVASQKAKDSFIDQKNELNTLTTAYQKTTAAINGMSAEMDELGDVQAVNSLEIRKIRFEAEKDGRELTDKELARIQELEIANEDLGIQYDELAIQKDTAMEASVVAADAIERQTELTDAAAEAYNASAKELKTLPDILEQINTAGMTEPEIVKMFGSIEAAGAILALKGEGHADAYIAQLEAMENAQGASGDAFDQEEQTQARRFEKMKAQFADIAMAIGINLLPMLTQLLEAFLPILKTLGDWIKENPKLVTAILVGMAAFGGLLTMIGPILTLVSGIAAALPILGAAFAVLTGPVGIIIAVIAGLVAIGIAVYKNWDWIAARGKELWGGLKTFFGWIGEGIKNIFINMTPIGFIINNWELISDVAMKIFGGIVKFFQGIPTKIKSAFRSLADIMLAPFRLYVEGLERAINWIIRQINKISIKMPSWLPPPLGGKSFGFDIPTISLPKFAEGGMINEPTLLYGLRSKRPYAIAGEAGPEAVVPGGGGGGEVSINMYGPWNVRSSEDISGIGEAVGIELRKILDRKANLRGATI